MDEGGVACCADDFLILTSLLGWVGEGWFRLISCVFSTSVSGESTDARLNGDALVMSDNELIEIGGWLLILSKRDDIVQ